MVSLIQYGNGGPTIYVGLHNDPKPENADNGSIIIEMDTSKVYFFDVDNSTWWEWGAESASASTLSITRPSLTLGNTFSPDVVEPDVMEEAMPEAAEEEMPESTTEDGEGE